MLRVTVGTVGLLGIGLWGASLVSTLPVQAASFDCAKAKAPIEGLICASPAINALDDQLKITLEAALKQAGDGRAALLAAHRHWLADLPKTCGVTATPAKPQIITCVSSAYTQYLAQLAPPNPAPTIASQPVPGPEVTLDHTQLPAAGTQATYFSLDTPGRVTVRAESSTGVALRLVDMIAGPLAESGEPGERDGRIDALLDRGRYKLLLTGAEKAPGTVTLTATTATELNTPAPALAQDSGETLTASLSDGEQRSYWLNVGSDPVTLVAAGRALVEMRLWRDGLALSSVQPQVRLVDIEPGKSQRVLTIAGKIDPGRYKLTLYGGETLRWPEGGDENPVSVRVGIPKLPGLDQRSGTIGATGIEQFIVPAPVNYTRLELASVTPVKLTAVPIQAGSGAYWGQSAEISKLSRRPVASLAYTPGNDGTLITIEGAPGLPYTLTQFQRAYLGNNSLTKKPNAQLVTLMDTGTAGATLPLTAMLYQGGDVLESQMPELAATKSLHHRVTLDGRSMLLFRVSESGRFRVKTEGVPHFWSVAPALGGDPISGDKPGQLELEAGYYRLNLRPSGALTGPVEVMLAGEDANMGAAPPKEEPVRLFSFIVPPAAPNSPLIPAILLGDRFDVPVGIAVYDLPLRLAESAPVVFALGAGEAKTLPLDVKAAGSLTVLDEAGKPVSLTLDGKEAGPKAALTPGARQLSVTNPGTAPSRFRLLFEAQARLVPPAPAPAAEPVVARLPRLTAGQTYAVDFLAKTPRSFDVMVEEPGLYRFETLGRLAMQARLKTRLLPSLAEASENGIGHNAVLEQYLRAGLYQLEVTALNGTEGRAQLALSRAPLTEGEALVVDQPARVGLARGTGAILPFTVERAGRYTLQVASLSQRVAFRLEDAEGWPILPIGYQADQFGNAGSRLTVPLAAGRYRVVLLPPALATRAVVRLTPELGEPPIPQGHGPHPLTLNTTQTFRWLEPEQPDQPRVPDSWEFSLPGPTQLTLGLTEGMVGTLMRETTGVWTEVGKVSHAVRFHETLAGGRYRLSVTALARNNRLAYRLTSETVELLPDQPRLVPLPNRQSFTLDTPQTVRLSSFGTRDVTATLRDAQNRIIAQSDDRQNDWNFVIVQALPAGRYSLSLTGVAPPPTEIPDPQASSEDEYSEGDYDESEEVSSETETGETPEPLLTPDPTLSPLDRLSAGEVELSLTYLPETSAAPLALALGKAERVTVAGTQALLPLTLPAGQGLTLVEAARGSELLFSLERQTAPDGTWETLGQASGPAPVVALLPGAERYRLRAVALGAVPASGRTLTLRQIALPSQTLGEALRFAPVEGSALTVARLRVPGAAAVDLGGSITGGVDVSGAAGVGQPVTGSVLLPRGDDVWLLRPQAETQPVTPRVLAPTPDVPTPLRLAGTATLAVPPTPSDRVQLWQVDAPQGQPMIPLGGASGLAPGSALALGSEPMVKIGPVGTTPMPLITLTRHLLARPSVSEAKTPALTVALDPRSSRDLRLLDGVKRLTLDLPAGIAVEVGTGQPLVWSGTQPISRQLETRSNQLRLFNLGGGPATVGLRQMAAQEARFRVTPQQSFKQFLGAAGSLHLAVEGQPGQVLVIEGASGAPVWQGVDGLVLKGKRLPIQGAGVLSLDHPAGLLAVWLDGAGASFWPEMKPQALTVPHSLKLAGSTQAVRVTLTEPSLLHLRSTAPLIAGLRPPNGGETIRLFPSGADWHRYVPAGEVELRLAAAQDGALSGSLELQASPVTRVSDGLSAPQPLAAGDTRAFAFTVPRAGRIGVGVRSARDPASVRLLDATGKIMGEGLVQYKTLAAGEYVLEVQAPSDQTLSIQAAIVGIAAPDRGPPPDVRQRYLDLVGLR